MTPLTRGLSTTRETRGLRAEVQRGLSSRPRRLPTRLLYDAEGSRLFERITELPEYYLTRTELGILRACLPEISERVGPGARVVEPGAGNGTKADLLLKALRSPAAYLPVDVSIDPLRTGVRALRARHPRVEVRPLAGDYTRARTRLAIPPGLGRILVFFPGSTIGNLGPTATRRFLLRMAEVAGSDGMLLLGADLRKPRAVLEPAYDDAEGVTAAFNRNLLRHLNARLGTDFDPQAYRHEAPWVEARSRIEMRLVALEDQVVTFPTLDGDAEPSVAVRIPAGASLVTEHSRKFTQASLDRILASTGWRTVGSWTDPSEWFAVRLLERDRVPAS